VTIREEISVLSHDVNDFLRGYVQVHDYVFAGSIRHIIPIPFFFKATDFANALSALEIADLGLEKCVTSARHIAASSSANQTEYLLLLVEYVAALRKTISLFQAILLRLNAKLSGKSYSWRVYRGDVSAYRESIEIYVSMGGSLKKKLDSLDV
jgi:hypothetical protein